MALYDLPILPSLPGLGSGESSYGSAPYAETAARAQARLGLRDRLLAGLAGLGSVQPGMNFGQSFTAALGGSARATWAAKQAALNYAQRQVDQEIARQNAETQRLLAEQAVKAKPEKPAPPPKPEKLVTIAGPNGPIYVRESDAIGKAPYVKPEKTTIPKVPKPATPPKPSSGQERSALNFYNRMKEAETTVQSLESKIAKQNIFQQYQLQSGPNITQSPEQQIYRQAQRAFTEARLRKESGAAIPPQEYANDAKTYFYQPGDSQAVTKKKREARAAVLAGLKFAAGKAYGEFYGEGGGTPADTSKSDPLGIR